MRKIHENEIIGKRFGRLTIKSEQQKRIFNSTSIRSFLCLCDCGKEKSVMLCKLVTGKTKSCGCLKSELSTERKTKHGMAYSEEYLSWINMKQRCYDKKSNEYHRYGKRGIFICPEWKNDFKKFYDYIGKKPSKNHSIDRIDNNKGYEYGNVRWANKKEQGRNKRSNIILEYKGERKCISEWAEIKGINLGTLFSRIKRSKWTAEKAIETPIRKSKTI